MVPDGQEQSEVDVAGLAIAHVVEPMQRGPCHHLAQPARPHVHVGVLQQQLDGNGESQHRRHRVRHAQQQQRQHPAQGFGRLVQRVLHQSVEPIHAGHAVVDCVQPPQPGPAMAGVMHQGDAHVRGDDCQHHLRHHTPVRRPQLPRHPRGHQRNRTDRQQVQSFIHQRMDRIAARIALGGVEGRVIGPAALGQPRQRDGQHQPRQQPQGRPRCIPHPPRGHPHASKQHSRRIQRQPPSLHRPAPYKGAAMLATTARPGLNKPRIPPRPPMQPFMPSISTRPPHGRCSGGQATG